MFRNRSGIGSSSTHSPGAAASQSFFTRSGQRTANSAAIQPPRLTPPRITSPRPMVSASPPLRDRNTRAPYFSFLSASNMGENLSGKQLHALAGQLVRQGAGLAAGQDHTAAKLLLILRQFLAHGFWTADDAV